MTPLLKKIIIIVAVAGIIIFVAYKYMSGSDNATSDVLGTVAIDNSNTGVGTEVINTLIRIKQLKIDDSLFKDDVYRSLKDFSQPIVLQPKGRPNPFEPLPKSSSASSSRGSQF